MSKRPSVRRSDGGYTLVELMITVAIVGIMTASIIPLFKLAQYGLSSGESRSSLKTVGENSVNRIVHQLEQCKRIFENNASDNAFKSRAQLTGLPSALTGSALPIIEENGGISPSTTTFVAGGVGNSLFFAAIDQPVTVSVADSALVTQTLRLDVYHFVYYYLGTDSGYIQTTRKINLWEWQSVKYVDYNQIVGIVDATEKTHALTALSAAGYPYSWNPSTTTVTAAFFTIAGGALTAAPNHDIPEASGKQLISIVTGILGSGYAYSISPNTSASFQTSATVPLFATASGLFPSGFEVVVVGPNSARQVFVRLVLVAAGGFKNINSQATTALVSARDLW
jgi:prepilin-type N-terminal cleavage/methylation domain-containing protein